MNDFYIKDIGLNVSIDKDKISKEIAATLNKQLQASITREIRQQTEVKTEYRNNVLTHTTPPILQMIKDKAEEHYLSDKIQAKIQQYLDDNFDRILAQKIDAAIAHKVNTFIYNSKELDSIKKAAKALKEERRQDE